MGYLAEIPNWCQQQLPPTGLSAGTTLAVIATLSIVAGYCLLRGTRRAIVVGLVVAVGVGGFVSASPASAVSGITCPSGYEVFPQPAKMSVDFSGARLTNTNDEFETTDSTFTANVDLNGGTIYQPFTVEITGSAIATRPLNAGPQVVTGNGWTAAFKNGDKYSGAVILTYSPTGATTKVPPAEVRFGLETNGLQSGGKWTVVATASGIPAATASASASYPFAIYWDTGDANCSGFVSTFTARVEAGRIVTTDHKIVGGAPPYKYVATGLSGYTMADDGTITWVDAKPGTATDFQLTVTDANGVSLTVPGTVAYAVDFIYVPNTC